MHPQFVWYAFQKGSPVVLVSGCHYVDCHYIDANRSTVRRIDGLWDKLIKMGIRPERLMLEWCSAAEGARWQTIMQEVEKKLGNVEFVVGRAGNAEQAVALMREAEGGREPGEFVDRSEQDDGVHIGDVFRVDERLRDVRGRQRDRAGRRGQRGIDSGQHGPGPDRRGARRSRRPRARESADAS